MLEKEKAFEEQRRIADEANEKDLKIQLDKEKNAQQMREIEVKLQEIVPKINESNMICRELKRENIYYKPDIASQTNPDGSRTFKCMVLVYPDKNKPDEFSKIPYDTFMDQTYFTIKDLYDDMES